MTESVGAELARVREERGLSISDVAQQLKFAPRQIEALEQERFDRLPGGTFVRGMLRSYARLLKLEPEPLVERIAGRFASPDAATLAARYSQPVPFSDNARRSTFVYLALSLGVLTIGGGIAYQWYREHNQSAQIAKRPAPPKPAAASAPRAQPKVADVSAPAEITKTAQTKQASEPAAVEKVATAKVAKTAPNGAVHRLLIQCDEEAWIEVKDANDRMLVSSLNPKGAERMVQSRGPLTLVIGNAPNVRVIHNDRPIDLAPHTKAAIARFTLP